MGWKDKKQAKIYYKIYYVKHKNKLKARARAWRKAHLERAKKQRKTYYDANSDKAKKDAKTWRDANLEREKAICKAWRTANKEQKKISDKTYREANRDKLNAQKRAYRQANPEANNLWRKANPEKYRDKSRKRRALTQKVSSEPINEKVVYLRDGWICQHCKQKVDKKLRWPDPMSTSLDHIVPLTQGGTHTYSNVQLAHLRCNISKKDRVLPQGEQLRIF